MGWNDSAMLPNHDPQRVTGDILGGSSSPVILPWSCLVCCCCSRMASRSWSPSGWRALDLPLNFWGGRGRASGSGTGTGFGRSSSLSVTVWRLLGCGCWVASRPGRLPYNVVPQEWERNLQELVPLWQFLGRGTRLVCQQFPYLGAGRLIPGS